VRPPPTEAPTIVGELALFTLETAPRSSRTGGVTVPVTLAGGAFKGGVIVPAATLVGKSDCVPDDDKVPDCELVTELVTLGEKVGVTDGDAPLERVDVGEEVALGVEDEVILKVGSIEGVNVPITLVERVGVTDGDAPLERVDVGKERVGVTDGDAPLDILDTILDTPLLEPFSDDAKLVGLFGGEVDGV
jgi:hypothetical protein